MRLAIKKLLGHLNFGVLALLSNHFQLIKGILRDFLNEIIHHLVRLENVPEEFLSVRPSLCTCSCFNIVFYSLPIFAVQLYCL